MSSAHRPSAIIFGNDLMAVAGLSTLAELGYGAAVATRLFDLLEGAAPAAHLYSTPKLRARQSSGPPPGGAAHG